MYQRLPSGTATALWPFFVVAPLSPAQVDGGRKKVRCQAPGPVVWAGIGQALARATSSNVIHPIKKRFGDKSCAREFRVVAVEL